MRARVRTCNPAWQLSWMLIFPAYKGKKQEWDQHRLPVLTAWKNELFARRSGAAPLFLIFPVQFRVLFIALIMTERLAHPPVRPYGDWRIHEFSHLKKFQRSRRPNAHENGCQSAFSLL